MMAISLWQPWASFLVHGFKTIETRHWKPRCKIPCTLVIHAAKRQEQRIRDLCHNLAFHQALAKLGYHGSSQMDYDHLPYGCLIGEVTLYEIQRTEEAVLDLQREGKWSEIEFGDYSPGRWAWHCMRPLVYPEPLPLRGRQGMWTLSIDWENWKANT